MGTPARVVSRPRRALAAWTRWLWPPAWMALLWLASSIPSEPDAGPSGLGRSFAWMPPTLQNLLHLPAYGLLAWLWLRALAPAVGLRPALVIGVALTAGYGVVDEWHQAAVPGRYPSATDAAVNAVAALAAAAAYAIRDVRRSA